MTETPAGSGEFRAVYEAGGTLPMRLEVQDVEHPPGHHYVHHRLVVADGRPAAVILALDAAAESVLLVRSYRRAAGAHLWELPRGSSDVEDSLPLVAGGARVDEYSDEALLRAGLRELLEETGYAGRNARVIGRHVADSTVFPQRAGVVLCTVDRDAVPGATDGEVDEVRWFSLEELRGMIAGGEIIDSHTLSAFAFFWAR